MIPYIGIPYQGILWALAKPNLDLSINLSILVMEWACYLLLYLDEEPKRY